MTKGKLFGVIPIDTEEALGTAWERNRLGTALMAPSFVVLLVNGLLSVALVEGGARLLGGDEPLGTRLQRDRLGTALMLPTLPVLLVNGGIAVLLSLGVPYALGVLLRKFTGGDGA